MEQLQDLVFKKAELSCLEEEWWVLAVSESRFKAGRGILWLFSKRKMADERLVILH